MPYMGPSDPHGKKAAKKMASKKMPIKKPMPAKKPMKMGGMGVGY